MKFSEIKELLDAGFTRDDILALAGVEAAGKQAQPEQQAQKAQPEQQAQKAQPEQQAQKAQPADNNGNTMQALADTVAALSKTVKDMQLSNAKSADGGKPKPVTSADVVKSFFSE